MKLPRAADSIRTAIIYKFINKLKRAPTASRLPRNAAKKSSNSTKKNTPKPNFLLNLSKHVQFRRILLYVGIVMLVLLIGGHIHIYNSFNTKALFPGEHYPIQDHVSTTKDKSIVFIGYNVLPNDQFSIGLISVATIDFQTGQINIYTLNSNIKSFEGIPLRDYFSQFTFAEGKKYTLINSVELSLGIKIDNYIAFNLEGYESKFASLGFGFDVLKGKYISSDLVKNNSLQEQDAVTLNQETWVKSFLQQITIFQYYRVFLSSSNISNTFETDLDKNELLYTLYNIANLDKKFNTLSTTGSIATKEDSVLIINQSVMYEKVKAISQKISVITEQAEVEVFNGSGTTGLASRKRRELEQLGINIVRFGNYPDTIEGNIIYVPGANLQEYKFTLQEIERNLGGKVTIETEGYDLNYTGDIIVVLGK